MKSESAVGRGSRRMLCALLLFGLAGAAGANELDINFHSDAVRFTGAWDVTGQLRADAGWMHHTDDGDVGHIGIHLVDLATGGTQPITAGLGGRFVYFDSDRRNRSGGAVPLGGFLRFNLADADRFHVGGYGYWAPSVLSFANGDGYRELGAFVGYEVLRQGSVYLGWRNIHVDFDNRPSVTIDSGFHLGLRIRF